MRVVLLVTLASLCATAGCAFNDEIDTSEAALAIRLPAIDGLDEVSLTIYAEATCADKRALGGEPLAGFANISLRENEQFAGSISVGDRAFEITGMADTGVCVGACEEAEVIAGMLVEVTLEVLEVPCSD
jgi:hypothetical protein